MNAAIGRQIRTLALGILALLLPGCADMPAWVPFQGPRTDQVPGVVTPAEKITQLKKLSSEAAKSDQQGDARHGRGQDHRQIHDQFDPGLSRKFSLSQHERQWSSGNDGDKNAQGAGPQTQAQGSNHAGLCDVRQQSNHTGAPKERGDRQGQQS